MTEPEKTRYEKLHEHLAKGTTAIKGHRENLTAAAQAYLDAHPNAPLASTSPAQESDEQAANGD